MSLTAYVVVACLAAFVYGRAFSGDKKASVIEPLLMAALWPIGAFLLIGIMVGDAQRGASQDKERG